VMIRVVDMLARPRSCRAAGKMQCPRDRVAADRTKAALYVRGEPWLHGRGEPADERNARSAGFDETAHQFVDLLGGIPHDAAADRIAGVGLPHHGGPHPV